MNYEEKKWIKACNIRAKKSDWLPSAICKKPGQMMEMIENDRDIKLILYIVKAIIKTHQDGNLHSQKYKSGSSKILTLEVSGDAIDPDVKVTHKSFPGSRELVEMCEDEMIFDNLSELPDISDLPKLNKTWVTVPVYISNDKHHTDDCILVVAEENSRRILHADIISMDIEEAIRLLFGVFGGDNAAESIGVPKKLIVAEAEFYTALRDLQECGLEVCFDKDHPVAEDIRKSMERDLPGFIDKHLHKYSDVPEIDLSVVPADDDMGNWKKVQQVLTARFANLWFGGDSLRKTRIGKKFFGDSDWEYYLEEYNEMMVLPTYVTWAALTHKSGKKAATFAESLLEEDLPEPLRISLESLNNSYPSLYQIKETNSETGNLILKDLLLSKTLTIHDNGMSKTAKQDWIIPLRVYPVGNFHFADIAGPIFSPFDATTVIKELQKLKLPADPKPDWLRKNGYIFGRLWPLYDELHTEGSALPKLANTDGEPLEFITAYFECDNPGKARDKLSERDDVDFDDDEDTYIWFKDNPGNSMMETTLLARVSFEKRRIKAEVNSESRLDSLIEMLEAIEGVRYLEHESKDIEQMLKEIPEDNDRPAQKTLPPEFHAAVQEKMAKYYIDWLDEPNPALDNKTPRQTVKTKKGAQKVKVMIETIPTLPGDDNIKIPKKEMLRNIGLSTEVKGAK